MTSRYGLPSQGQCGPRFSIIEGPYPTTARTSMRTFEMCPKYAKQYHNPGDRQFHAQPNASPKCGPELELWDEQGSSWRRRVAAPRAVAIRDGLIVAVKGPVRFQLMVDASKEWAVRRLGHRRRREVNPFAPMFYSLQAIPDHACFDEMEERLLCSPEAPIVHLRRKPGRDGTRVSDALC